MTDKEIKDRNKGYTLFFIAIIAVSIIAVACVCMFLYTAHQSLEYKQQLEIKK